MSSSLTKTVLSGFIFGQSIAWSGLLTILSDNDRKSDHLRLGNGQSSRQNTFGLQLTVLYTAVLGTSSLVIHAATRSGRVTLAPRQPSSYGWFAYDGNVIGGLMQGTGMAMVKSEPGIVLLRVGMGESQAWWVLLGGVLGGFCYVTLNEKLKRSKWSSDVRGGKQTSVPTGDVNVGSTIAWAKYALLLLGLALSVVLLMVLILLLSRHSSYSLKQDDLKAAVLGGLVIGSSQLTSLILTNGTLGVSSFYPVLAIHFLRVIGGRRSNPGYNALYFTAGVILSGVVHGFRIGHVDSVHQTFNGRVDAGMAVLAGCLMILGARIAGGCTSGHGISGCSLFCTSSYITVLMMVGGILLWNFAGTHIS